MEDPDNRIDYAQTVIQDNLKLYKPKKQSSQKVYPLCGTQFGGYAKLSNNIKYKVYSILIHHLKNRFRIFSNFKYINKKYIQRRINYLYKVKD